MHYGGHAECGISTIKPGRVIGGFYNPNLSLIYWTGVN
jgi:hypothetical protein